jgi:hypothetical protein
LYLLELRHRLSHVFLPASILAALIAVAVPARAESYRSENFAVEAPSAQAARRVAARAEKCRKELIQLWLGKQPLTWEELCTVEVDLSARGRWGASRFTFGDNYNVRQAHISLRGSMDELLNRVLPHEVTHTVLISYFGRPIPRWADEGAAILSEDDSRREEHDRRICRMIHRQNQTYSLKYLLSSRDYPGNLDVFYTQSYSVTRFLVEQRGRKTFLAFLDDGMENGWERAVKTFYKYKDLNDMDRAWRKHLEQDQTRILVKDFAAALANHVPMRSAMTNLVSRGTLQALLTPTPAAPATVSGDVIAMPQ